MKSVHHHEQPEEYAPTHVRSDNPLAGVLHDRTAPLPIERNPQTLAEHRLAVADRPVHYTAGLRATICEVYHAAKQSPDWAHVTCTECQKLRKRTGR